MLLTYTINGVGDNMSSHSSFVLFFSTRHFYLTCRFLEYSSHSLALAPCRCRSYTSQPVAVTTFDITAHLPHPLYYCCQGVLLLLRCCKCIQISQGSSDNLVWCHSQASGLITAAGSMICVSQLPPFCEQI